MAALAICAITAALLKDRTDAQRTTPGPARPAATGRPRHDPADRPGDRPPARRLAHPARPARPHRLLARLEADATKPSPAGITSAHDSPGKPALPRSASEWLLPY